MKLLQLMKQYSAKATALRPVAIPDPLILLDEGFNTFTFVTDNLDGTLDLLKNEGVTVQEVFTLEQEASSLKDILVEGESEAKLGLYGAEV